MTGLPSRLCQSELDGGGAQQPAVQSKPVPGTVVTPPNPITMSADGGYVVTVPGEQPYRFNTKEDAEETMRELRAAGYLHKGNVPRGPQHVFTANSVVRTGAG